MWEFEGKALKKKDNNIDISKRLELVAGLVSNEIIADIGTDHGYVPIYLYKQGKIKKAYACDVRKGRWKNANRTSPFTARRM